MTNPSHTKEGLSLISYSTEEGIELNCWFEYQAEERGARGRNGEQLEPDYPATWSLWHAYLPNSNVDLCPLMRRDLIEEIEGWAVYQAEESAEDRAWNDGYDKYQDWKDAQ